MAGLLPLPKQPGLTPRFSQGEAPLLQQVLILVTRALWEMAWLLGLFLSQVPGLCPNKHSNPASAQVHTITLAVETGALR